MKAATKRVRATLAGSAVIFLGYDGNRYAAYVEAVRKGVAVISYRVAGFDSRVTAYISDPDRLITKGDDAALAQQKGG